ncbi:unnamed protein product [Linum tenue]|uniref:Dual specificity protein phosphatase 1 n=2 Tax=Linum tenue TaxID=586396 RepID=A0AAV0P598_9ROSI|nr:unnamed protein product [Linum tenue]
MAQFDDVMKNQIAAILKVINFSRCLKEDKIPCHIEDGLFLGSVGAANNKNALRSSNISHVLTIANSLAPVYPNDFVYKVIAVADREETNLRQYFDECINFIDEAKRQGGGVLVHCFVGKSRSVTIVLAYLMKKHGMTVSQALEHVKSRRPQASPNAGFILQLQELLHQSSWQIAPVDVMKNQIATILRVIDFSRCFKDDNIPCHIEDGLYLGSVGAALNKNALRSNNITHVLTLLKSLPPIYTNDIVYKAIAVTDREETNLREYFDECINFIYEARRQGGCVLVHCYAGRSRSVTIVLAYLMKKHGMTVSQALEHVKSRRPQASPNSGFILQLQEYERFLRGSSSC